MGAALFVGGPGGLWSGCAACTQFDTSDWLFCDEDYQHSLPSKAKSGKRRRGNNVGKEQAREVSAQHLEELTKQLFKIHDLNGDGMLQESELITLNEQIAILHHGKDTDTSEVRKKYHELFRAKLDPEGRPVPYETFREYADEVLDGLDNDPEAQEMILEQFVAEARSGRQAFDLGITELLDLAPEPTFTLEVAAVGLTDEALKTPPMTPRLPATRSAGDDGIDPPLGDVKLLDCRVHSNESSPGSGGKEDIAEDLAGCSTDAPSPRPGATAAESSAEEAMSSAEAGTAGPVANKLPGVGARTSSEESAPGDTPLVPHSVTESSLEDDLPMLLASSRAPGTLVVEQRNVRRAGSFPSHDEDASDDMGERPRSVEPSRAEGFEDLAPGPL